MIAQRSDAQIRSCEASDVADKIEIVEVDDIISYHDMMTTEIREARAPRQNKPC
jgi:hypothetical protein